MQALTRALGVSMWAMILEYRGIVIKIGAPGSMRFIHLAKVAWTSATDPHVKDEEMSTSASSLRDPSSATNIALFIAIDSMPSVGALSQTSVKDSKSRLATMHSTSVRRTMEIVYFSAMIPSVALSDRKMVSPRLALLLILSARHRAISEPTSDPTAVGARDKNDSM
jgi:hypothetical protein